MLNEIYQLGGDTDTIGAMAGAIWGAFNGHRAIQQVADTIENSELIASLASRLHQRHESLGIG